VPAERGRGAGDVEVALKIMRSFFDMINRMDWIERNLVNHVNPVFTSEMFAKNRFAACKKSARLLVFPCKHGERPPADFPRSSIFLPADILLTASRFQSWK
jgi:hypothetical protein